MSIITIQGNKRLEAGLHLAIWSFFLLVHALIFAQFLRFDISLLRSLVNVLPMAGIFYANTWLVNRFVEKRQYGLFVFLVLLIFGAATFMRARVNGLFPDIREELVLMNHDKSWLLGALFTNLVVLIIGIFYQMLYNRYRTEKRNLAIITQQREAQLQALRAQINPHFLFNTLNNIYSLAVIRSDKTAPMVLKLSNLLRYVIYDGRNERVSIEREAEQISEFIELFQMRSEDLLDIRFRKKDLAPDQLIEPMILIPIVENCFKHCDFDSNPNARIEIELEVKAGFLSFKTENTWNPDNRQKDAVGGVGLSNIGKRLELKYPGAYSIEIRSAHERFFVHLKLPYHHDTN